MIALLGLLKGHQSNFVEKMSRMRFFDTINTLHKTSSEESEASKKDPNALDFIRKMH